MTRGKQSKTSSRLIAAWTLPQIQKDKQPRKAEQTQSQSQSLRLKVGLRTLGLMMLLQQMMLKPIAQLLPLLPLLLHLHFPKEF